MLSLWRSACESQRIADGRLRRLTTPMVVALTTLALPATALGAQAFKLTPHIANHTPIVKKPWPITIDVTRGKTKLSGSVKYKFLFDGAVVSTQPGHKFTNGVYKDSMTFPSNSLGEPLTLRIVVTTKYGTEHLDWAIMTKK